MAVANLVAWQLALTCLSIIGISISHFLWKKIEKVDYFIFKFYGIVVFSAIFWLFGYLKILPVFTPYLLAVLLLLTALSAVYIFKKKVKIDYKFFAIAELGFFLVLLAFLFVRGFYPTPLDGEKPMDIMMISSVMHTKFLPPEDVWFAGKTVNYYYFSYFFFALLGKMSFSTALITYNFGLGSIWAMIAVSLGALAYKITSRVLAVVTVPFMYLLAGNFDAVKQIFTNITHSQSFNWWLPSRAIAGTITEFPAFSYLFGDFHPHMTVAVWLVSCLYYLKKATEFIKINIWHGLFLGLVVGEIFVISTWSFATVGLILLGYLIYYRPDLKAIGGVIIGIVLPVIFYVASTTSITKGIAVFTDHTNPLEWLNHWSLLLVPVFFYLFSKGKNKFIGMILLVGVVVLLIPEIAYIKDAYGSRYNTAFKFYYDAWLLLSIVAGIGIASYLRGKIYQKILAIIIIVATLPYLFYSLPDRFQHFKTWYGLDPAVVYLNQYPEQATAYKQLIELNGARIFDKPADSFSSNNLISAFTGSYIPMGWTTHEELWRNFDSYVYSRKDAADAIVNCQIPTDYITQYNISYCLNGNYQLEKVNEGN